MSKLIDLTGKEFGSWKVLKRGPNKAGGKATWECLCQACGNIKFVDGSHLRGGHSTNCGCLRVEALRRSRIKDETGHRYGKLVVLEKDITPEGKEGLYWKCQCDCGNIITVKGDYLRNGDTQSCGCIISKQEMNITKLLTSKNIQFQRQYSFPDLLSKKNSKLYFDFAIFNNNQLLYLIEYDGEQHFNEKHAWNSESYTRNKNNDIIKNQYCFEHNIPIIRIPYDSKYTINDLILETTRFLFTKDNAEEYYSSH